MKGSYTNRFSPDLEICSVIPKSVVSIEQTGKIKICDVGKNTKIYVDQPANLEVQNSLAEEVSIYFNAATTATFGSVAAHVTLYIMADCDLTFHADVHPSIQFVINAHVRMKFASRPDEAVVTELAASRYVTATYDHPELKPRRLMFGINTPRLKSNAAIVQLEENVYDIFSFMDYSTKYPELEASIKFWKNKLTDQCMGFFNPSTNLFNIKATINGRDYVASSIFVDFNKNLIILDAGNQQSLTQTQDGAPACIIAKR